MLTYANLKRFFLIQAGKEWVDALTHRVGLAPRDDESVGLVFYLVNLGQTPTSFTDDKLQVIVDQSHAIALARGILAMAEQNNWPIPDPSTLQMHLQGGRSN